MVPGYSTDTVGGARLQYRYSPGCRVTVQIQYRVPGYRIQVHYRVPGYMIQVQCRVPGYSTDTVQGARLQGTGTVQGARLQYRYSLGCYRVLAVV